MAIVGWWQVTADGDQTPGATGMVWGDELADIMDEAVERITTKYAWEWNRPPTEAELIAGLRFTLAAR